MGATARTALTGMLASLITSVALLSFTAIAGAQEPLDSPGKTDRIVLVDSKTTADGMSWDFYRNLDYPCSISGYQTFAVGTKTGSSPTDPRPLWVRMRGGGVGYFDSAGNPQPSAGNKTENNFDTLIGFSEGNDLNKRINDEAAGFRNLSVSMCSHDIYGGADQVDPNNPNLTPEGQPRHTNGLFATKAAIRFVQEKYPTTRTFLHGTSAGSAGTFSVAYSLQLEDRPVAGYIADSGVPNPQNEADQNAAGTSCARGDVALAAIVARIDPFFSAHPPDQLVGQGLSTSPVFNIWNKNDTNACGDEQLPCTLPDGSVKVLSGSECRESHISPAIASLPADRHSVDMRVCVESSGGPPGNCLRHVVTTVGPNNFPNTDPSAPADYNGAILAWVNDRMTDTPPALDVGLGKQSKIRSVGRRVGVTCVAGGYEQRTCNVKLEARSHGKRRTIARGKGTMAPGTSTLKLKLKLTGKGRKLVKHAPRKGLKVKALTTASERYTDRAGEDTRKLRIR